MEDENILSRGRQRGKRMLEDKGVFYPKIKMNINEKNLEFPRIETCREKLDKVRVVLVEIKYPGNIGQVARAMRNLGFRKLILVNPKCMIDAESEKMAVGAEDMLDSIHVTETLDEAIKKSRIVIGATRRRGMQRRNIIDPRLCAELVEPILEAGDISMVFGREDSGLSNEELAHCHWIASIPSSSEKCSFNISHAVAVFLYEISYRLLMPLPRNYALHEKYEAMYDHIEKFARDIGFLKEKDPARMMLVIRQMLYRSQLSEREVRIVRGIITQAYWQIANPDRSLDEAPPGIAEPDSMDRPEDD